MFRFLLAFTLVLLVIPAANAQESREIFSGSRRFSIETPEDWVQAEEEQVPYVGEMLYAAESTEVLTTWRTSYELTGAVVIVYASPIAAMIMFGQMPDEKTDEELLLLGLDISGSTPEKLVDFSEINGYPAAITETRSGIGSLSIIAVLAEGMLYRITLQSSRREDSETLLAIAHSLTVYPDGQPGERVPLRVDELSLPVEPGWLIYEAFAVPFKQAAFQFEETTSFPQSYLILPEQQPELIEHALMASFQGQGTETLAGTAILVNVYPYDYLFGSAAVEITDTMQQEAINSILNDLNASPGEIEEISVAGTAGHKVELQDVLGGENEGTLLMIDANRSFYTIAVIGPAETWNSDYVTYFLNGLTLRVQETEIGLQVGMQAPDFTVELADGSSVNLSDYRGQVVLLNFWASWCTPCVEEIPTLKQIDDEHDEVVVLAVNFMENSETVTAFIAEHELTFPVALDEQGEINDLYHIQAWPTNLLINPDGTIVGFLPSHEIVTHVANLLEQIANE